MDDRRTRMSWDPRPRPVPKVDPMDSLVAFLLQEMPSERDLVDAYSAARARAEANGQNYRAWLNGEREPNPALPDGPDEKAIPGLELALRIVASRLSTRPDYRKEWRL